MISGMVRAGACMLACYWIGLLAAVASAYAAAAPRAYVLAVVPQMHAADIEQSWKPVVDRLSKDAGVKIELRLYPSIPQFESAFLAGTPDFVYLNPYHQVMARRAQGYIPLVRDGSALLTGILVVRRDGPIRTLQDLNGKSVSFPAPLAFGASLYMRGLLGELYRLNITPDYVGNHINVIRAVLAGEAVAGGIANNMLKRESSQLPESSQFREQLRIIYETPGVAPHPLSVHPRVPQAVRDKVMKSMLEMASKAEGAKLLEAIMMPQPVKADYGRDYARLEQINLKKYLGNPAGDTK